MNTKHINSLISSEAYTFVKEHITDADKEYYLATNTLFNISAIEDNTYNVIINLKRLNDSKPINKQLRAFNKKLPENGKLIGFIETYATRKYRILKKYPKYLNHIYYVFDVFLTRITPKFLLTKRLYSHLSAGKGLVMSRTEVLGRLHYCGFKVIQEREIDHKLYFVVEKKDKPTKSDYKPSYQFIIKLPRVGKNGKIIKVYKLRTMHPYAEYLQKYVYDSNDLKEGGKMNNDFRISTVGKFLRKYWLDELPMLLNVLKGDMKLVGVRPLSQHYLSLYDEETKKLRLQTKPGLLPPFYADLPKTLNEIQESETNYLNNYLESPFKTDCKYLYKILTNIVLKNNRSA